MDERQKIAIDWKWDEPCWPMFNFRGTAANMAAMMTRRRCHWCGAEVMGFDGVAWIMRHTELIHPGREVTYTVYPPAIGLVVKGGDA